jgi:hypothetical protein
LKRGSQELRYGRIIWATLKDHNGYRKSRPTIVLTPTNEIKENTPIVVMAITTTFGEPPPDDHVPLPFNPDPRRVGTQLARRSAAVTSWLDTLYADEITGYCGDVPPALMRRIQILLHERFRESNPPDPSA